SGQILIDQNVTLTAQSFANTGLGRVTLAIDAAVPPAPVSLAAAPSNFTVVTLSGGQVFYGNNAFTTLGNNMNVAYVVGGNLVFDDSSLNAASTQAISLGGGVTINA